MTASDKTIAEWLLENYHVYFFEATDFEKGLYRERYARLHPVVQVEPEPTPITREVLVRAHLGRVDEPELSLAGHVIRQFNSLSESSDERHKDLLEAVREELADLGYAW